MWNTVWWKSVYALPRVPDPSHWSRFLDPRNVTCSTKCASPCSVSRSSTLPTCISKCASNRPSGTLLGKITYLSPFSSVPRRISSCGGSSSSSNASATVGSTVVASDCNTRDQRLVPAAGASPPLALALTSRIRRDSRPLTNAHALACVFKNDQPIARPSRSSSARLTVPRLAARTPRAAIVARGRRHAPTAPRTVIALGGRVSRARNARAVDDDDERGKLCE
mmetsp:Transcript_8262/g.27402  ORF Transcript_8262/g.27402 Transcript_8262/m.27402 type:complete len:223 (+) Transcript_8262:3046-3714(+)